MLFIIPGFQSKETARIGDAQRSVGRGVHRTGTGFAVLMCVVLLQPGSVVAATAETLNFRVIAGERELAEEIARHAESLRRQLAFEWLGRELPGWQSPCTVLVDVTAQRITGDTTYDLGGGRVRRWRMTLRGPLERIVDSLLPHEIAHTVLASHFRTPVPRWADEGIALAAEDELDRRRLREMSGSFLVSNDWLTLENMLETDQYPADKRQLRVLYAQAASFTEFLLLSGKQRLLQFVTTGIEKGWVAAAGETYGFPSLAEFERSWRHWELEGRPEYEVAGDLLLAEVVRRDTVSLNVDDDL